MLYLIIGIIIVLILLVCFGPVGLVLAIVGFILWRLGALSFVFNMISKILWGIFKKVIQILDKIFDNTDAETSYLFEFARVLLS